MITNIKVSFKNSPYLIIVVVKLTSKNYTSVSMHININKPLVRL